MEHSSDPKSKTTCRLPVQYRKRVAELQDQLRQKRPLNEQIKLIREIKSYFECD